MTEEELEKAIYLNKEIKKLEGIIAQEGNPITLVCGINNTLNINPNSEIYNYMMIGLKEELDRFKALFEGV